MPGGVRTEIHLGAEETDGAFCLLVDQPPAGWSLPPHRHRDEAETIHVVEGELWMEVDGVRSELRAGETIHIPRGVLHSGGNAGPAAGRRVVIVRPAGMERFVLEAGAARPEDVDVAATVAAATRHGWEF
jgi:quercetin dioxygenase-like cupin family protein